ncbi:MAG: MFS transporter [Candidatus Nanopelagicales bacterium]|nr:MFS transporter [Candidatus Nanopelagicales bacterium]
MSGNPERGESANSALIAANVGNAIEFYDWMAYALLVPYFGSQFFPSSDPAAVLMASFAVFAAGFLARPLGAVFLGRYIDRHGRRPGLILSVVLIVIATLGMAVAPTYDTVGALAPALLVVLRLTQGFALGPEFGGSATYLIESAPEHRRGLFASTYMSTVALGTVAVSLLITILELFFDEAQMDKFGWRIVFAVGALLAVIGLLLRRNMPETDSATPDERLERTPYAVLWREHRLECFRILLLSGAGLVVMYGMVSLLPSFGPTFTDLPVETASFIGTVGFMVMLLASPLFGLLSDRIGRVWTLRVFAISGAVLCVPAFALLNGQPGPQIVAQLLAVLLLCAWAAGSVTSFPEMLAPSVRATGVSAPFGIAAAVFGGFAPLAATALSTGYGTVAAGVLVAAFCAIGGLATIKMRETAFTPLRTD